MPELLEENSKTPIYCYYGHRSHGGQGKPKQSLHLDGKNRIGRYF